MRSRDHLLKAILVLGALIVGVAFGRWETRVGSRVSSAAAIAPASLPNEFASEEKPAIAAQKIGPPIGHFAAADFARIIKDRKNRQRVSALTDYVNHLSAADFSSASLFTRDLPHGADRDLATGLLVARWAELDPEGALAFAASHKGFEQITEQVFQDLAANDLHGALTRAQAMSDPGSRYQALRGALSVMAESEPAGAVQLAESSGNFARSEPLSQMIYRQWSATDPQAAATAAEQDASTSGWRSPLAQVIRTWSSQDPQSALSYALTIGDPAAQARSVSDIVRRWSEQDANAAATWINTVPAGAARDAAVAALASAVSSTDIPAAVGWAQSISDNTARTSALQRVSRRVLWRDPDNGLATLQGAGVPMEILQALPPARR
jgi:hypothetical protein